MWNNSDDIGRVLCLKKLLLNPNARQFFMSLSCCWCVDMLALLHEFSKISSLSVLFTLEIEMSMYGREEFGG